MVKIGVTYENKEIKAFRIGDLTLQSKTHILFTALHHSREPISLAMITRIMFEKLHSLVHRAERPDVFDFADLLFIPVVNVDGYTFINEHFDGDPANPYIQKRKNFNHTVPCNEELGLVLGGVDLNRNYDWKFGIDEVGSVSDPCDQIYRGDHAFSETETQAVRQLIDDAESVSSAMNFHGWGNLWITPFNYYKGADYDKLMTPAQYKFYRDFEKEIAELGFKKAGNA